MEDGLVPPRPALGLDEPATVGRLIAVDDRLLCGYQVGKQVGKDLSFGLELVGSGQLLPVDGLARLVLETMMSVEVPKCGMADLEAPCPVHELGPLQYRVWLP